MKIIIWFPPLHSHTHSYVMGGFFRTAQSMGYETHWFSDESFPADFDFSDCLFLAEGQFCKSMPIVKGSKYILHNCFDEAMWAKIRAENITYLKLQVYTNDVLAWNIEKIEDCIYFSGDIIYMPWATDLLPDEIIYKPRNATNTSWWIGTIGEGEFGNVHELEGWKRACKENDVHFCHAANVSMEENMVKIRESFFAPAIVGTWQKSKGYIPCRIMKNISYGALGMTNSATVKELLGEHVVYNSDEHALFHNGLEVLNSGHYEKRVEDAMKFVKEKHTYVNRINTLLKFV